jgi:peptidoglycan/LPS O-acetylase OafA/YrhL
LFNFFLPFFLLLFRASKRNVQALRVLAGLVFVCQAVYAYWLVEPSFHPTGVHIHWMDFAAPVGLGGLWTAMFAAALKRAALLTQNDPRISYSFAHA